MEYCYYNCKCHSWLAFYSMHNELILGKKCNLKGDPSRIFPQKNKLRRTNFFLVFYLIVEKGAKLRDAAGARAPPLFLLRDFSFTSYKFQKLYVLKNQANISSAVCWQTTYIYLPIRDLSVMAMSHQQCKTTPMLPLMLLMVMVSSILVKWK